METGRHWGGESDENQYFDQTRSPELTLGRGHGVGMSRKRTLGARERAPSWGERGCMALRESLSSGPQSPLFYTVVLVARASRILAFPQAMSRKNALLCLLFTMTL